jgi:hypothetical protein
MLEVDKKRLTKLQENENWETLMKYLSEVIDRINAENVIGRTEFETLKMVFTKEGKKQALMNFFENLDRQLYD